MSTMQNSGEDVFAQRTYNQLKRDSEDIDRALEDFLSQRNEASRLQQDALNAYDAEMLDLDALDEDFEEYVVP